MIQPPARTVQLPGRFCLPAGPVHDLSAIGLKKFVTRHTEQRAAFDVVNLDFVHDGAAAAAQDASGRAYDPVPRAVQVRAVDLDADGHEAREIEPPAGVQADR